MEDPSLQIFIYWEMTFKVPNAGVNLNIVKCQYPNRFRVLITGSEQKSRSSRAYLKIWQVKWQARAMNSRGMITRMCF
jgi:hypothetical protein